MDPCFVAVQFELRYEPGEWGSKLYHFKTDIKDLEEGDFVVVDTLHGHTVARVAKCLDKSPQAFKYVVQRVGASQEQRRLQAELDELLS